MVLSLGSWILYRHGQTAISDTRTTRFLCWSRIGFPSAVLDTLSRIIDCTHDTENVLFMLYRYTTAFGDFYIDTRSVQPLPQVTPLHTFSRHKRFHILGTAGRLVFYWSVQWFCSVRIEFDMLPIEDTSASCTAFHMALDLRQRVSRVVHYLRF